MTIANRIRAVRQANGLTMTAVAKKIGVSPSAISKIESGKSNPDGPTIKNICREFNVSETWLRFGIGEMTADVPMRKRLMDWISEVSMDDTTAQYRIVEALMTLSEQDWEILERVAKRIADRDKSPPA